MIWGVCYGSAWDVPPKFRRKFHDGDVWLVKSRDYSWRQALVQVVNGNQFIFVAFSNGDTEDMWDTNKGTFDIEYNVDYPKTLDKAFRLPVIGQDWYEFRHFVRKVE